MSNGYFTKISFLILSLSLLLSAVSRPVAADDETREDKISIGILPEMNIFKQRERFEPLATFLSSELGIKIRLKMLTYGNVIEKMKDGEVDGAFLGSFVGALAISQLGAEPLARPVSMDGTSTYEGYIIVRQDSNIRTTEDMRGKTLALVEETTAGYVFPLAWFRQHGVRDLNTYFSEQFVSGSHDRAVALVLNGKADIGAVKSTVYREMRQWQPRIDRELMVLVNSPTVPSNGLCVSKDLDPELKQRLKDLLLNLRGYPEGRKALEQMGARMFVETDRAQYQPVFVLAEEAGLDMRTYGIGSPAPHN